MAYCALLRRFGIGVGLSLGIVGVVLLRYTHKDYSAYFLQQKGVLLSHETREIARSEISRTYEVELQGSHGRIVRARLRSPIGNGRRLPAVLVASGIETGHLVIKMLDEHPRVIVMAIRYPYSEDPDFSGWNAIPTLLQMRETGMKTIPSLLLALDYLLQNPSVDTNNIAVATVSFGTFVGVPAATLHPGVKRLIVVQGGGNLSSIIAANAERPHMPLPPKISGWLGKFILLPFEPNQYIRKFSPRSLLMVNSPGDLLFPDESAKSLYEHAGEPKEILWHETRHVMPGALDIIQELTNIVVEKLYADRQGPG